MARIEVKVLKVLRDNYVFLVNHRASGSSAVVDPGIAGPVVNKLDQLGWRVRKILCTHHHADQIGGNLDIKRSCHCEVVGPRAEAARIPGITNEFGEGDKVTLGDAEATILELPGHTSGGIGFWFKDSGVLFSGDILYPMGCGRMFEGTAEQMWNSLLKIRALPPDTKVYCAHEYAERNYKFARGLYRENAALRTHGEAFRTSLQGGGIGVPFTLSDELATNPFFAPTIPRSPSRSAWPERRPSKCLPHCAGAATRRSAPSPPAYPNSLGRVWPTLGGRAACVGRPAPTRRPSAPTASLRRMRTHATAAAWRRGPTMAAPHGAGIQC